MTSSEVVPALIVCSFMFGFVAAGAFETQTLRSSGIWGLMFLIFAVAAGMMLVGDGPIRPLWLQYLVLAFIPLIVGIVARWILGRTMSRQGRE